MPCFAFGTAKLSETLVSENVRGAPAGEEPPPEIKDLFTTIIIKTIIYDFLFLKKILKRLFSSASAFVVKKKNTNKNTKNPRNAITVVYYML